MAQQVMWVDWALLPPSMRDAWKEAWIDRVTAQCDENAPGSWSRGGPAPVAKLVVGGVGGVWGVLGVLDSV